MLIFQRGHFDLAVVIFGPGECRVNGLFNIWIFSAHEIANLKTIAP
jgi:hypothetical protein